MHFLHGFISFWTTFHCFTGCITSLAYRSPVTLTSVPFEVANLTNITVVGLLPFTGNAWPAGDTLLPAMKWAMQDIGQRKNILPGYRLVMHVLDSKCERGRGLDAVFGSLHKPPNKLMIAGLGCSSVGQPLTEALLYWNLTVVSYAASSPALSDRARYPRFFRTVAPDTSIVPARMAMMKHFGWTKIATVHETFELFTEVTDLTLEALKRNNWVAITSEVITTQMHLQVESLKRNDARIIFVGFYSGTGLKFLCEAYKAGFYGPHIVWVAMIWLETDWADQAPLYTSCTKEQILATLNHALFAGPVFDNYGSRQVPGISGISTEEFDTKYLAYFNNTWPYGVLNKNPTYDCMWACALALNKTLSELRQNDSNKGLEDFTYSDTEMTNLITKSMQGVEFWGVSGHISFDETGSVRPIIAIEQQLGNRRVTIGYYLEKNHKWQWINGGPKWPGGKVPADSTITIIRHDYISLLPYGIMALCAVLGIVQALGFFAFNVTFRTKRVIKMSSPNINNLMLVGCMLCYTTVLFADTEDASLSTSVICRIRLCTFVIGFSLAFGGLFSKTWRVHAILTTKTMKRNVVRDSSLVLMVLVLISINCLIIAVWQILDPFEATNRNITQHGQTKLDDIIIIPQISVCTSSYDIHFSGALYVVQGLTMAFGAFLAWETRKVKLQALNDSKQIGMCIYNVSVLSIFGGVVLFVIEDNLDLLYGILSALIIIGTLLTVNIVFVPKVLSVKRGDQAVGNILDTTNTQATGTGDTRAHSSIHDGTLKTGTNELCDAFTQTESLDISD